MKCQHCQIKSVQIRLTSTRDDGKEEILQLCEECANKHTTCENCQEGGKTQLVTIKGKKVCPSCEKKLKGDKPTLSTIKLTGCQCEYKDKTFEVKVDLEEYEESKDLFACCNCATGEQGERYKSFSKKQLGFISLGNKGNCSFFIIKGARQQPRGNERDKPKPDQPNINLGPDYNALKPVQQEGRKKTQASWINKKQISFIHLECDKIFFFDKNIESYYEAREKAKQELKVHKSACQKNNSQNNWEKERKAKGNINYTCQKCWGKIRWDKTITDYQTAKQQALSDLKYHQQHECHLIPEQRTIAIYHSPNQGGNQHAPIDNSLIDDDIFLQKEEEGEQVQEIKNSGFNWKHPLVIGGIIFAGLAISGLIVWLISRNKKEK